MRSPVVSIVVPTFNRAASLAQTLECLIDQTFQDWEIIISDDASSDDTTAVVRQFADPRIRYFRNDSNVGLYENWHRGIRQAKGKYVAIYHDHDLYLPSILEQSVDLLEKYPTASFVHAAVLMIDQSDDITAVDVRQFPEFMPGQVMQALLARQFSSPVMAATAMVRRTAYETVGGYRYDLYGLGCDLDMWFRLSSIGDVAYVATPQALIRERTKEQRTSRFDWRNAMGSLRMRSDHRARASTGTGTVDRIKEYARVEARLGAWMIRALMVEDEHVVAEGHVVMAQHGGLLSNMIVWPFETSPALTRAIKSLVIPLHRRRVIKAASLRKETARRYLDQVPNLRHYHAWIPTRASTETRVAPRTGA